MLKSRNLNLFQSQPTGVWYLILLSMWEYFSYYGMRALLILYLSEALLFSDRHAYALYGAYTSLVYMTPMLGGIIADRFLGDRNTVVCGAILMIIGHIILGTTEFSLGLYIALAFVVCGYGLFKSNISCVLGQLYQEKDTRRESGFALMYVGGNIGSFIAPLCCAYVANKWGWHYGFGLAGLGMAIGLAIFYFGRRHFIDIEKPDSKLFDHLGKLKFVGIGAIVIASIIAVAIFTVILQRLWVGWLLFFTTIVTLYFLGKLFLRCAPEQKRRLIIILLIMVFGLIFWAFDQQGGSSISLFIERNVIKQLGTVFIPAANFQSLSGAGVLIGGLFIAWLWRYLHRNGIHMAALLKIAIGMLVLTMGFFFISWSARLAIPTGHVSMLGVVLGMVLISFAELFIDPIALAEITRLNPANSVGFLAGSYMLITGSFANYLAAKVATLTSVATNGQHTINLRIAAQHYHATFHLIVIVALFATILLLVTAFLVKLLLRK